MSDSVRLSFPVMFAEGAGFVLEAAGVCVDDGEAVVGDAGVTVTAGPSAGLFECSAVAMVRSLRGFVDGLRSGRRRKGARPETCVCAR